MTAGPEIPEGGGEGGRHQASPPPFGERGKERAREREGEGGSERERETD